MTASMLSLCCGAMPVGGVVRTYRTYQGGTIYHLGHCTLCGQAIPFAPDGVLETSPKWLRLPPLHALPKPELRAVGNGMGHYTSEGAAKLCGVCNKPLEDQSQTECYNCWSKDVNSSFGQPQRRATSEEQQQFQAAAQRYEAQASVDPATFLNACTALDKANNRFVVCLCIGLAGWLAFIALGTWSALHRGRHREGQGGQRGLQGFGEELRGSGEAVRINTNWLFITNVGHAPQPATKSQGGKQ